MTDILNKTIVLVLHRNWPAMNTRKGNRLPPALPKPFSTGQKRNVPSSTWRGVSLSLRRGEAPHEAGLKLLNVPCPVRWFFCVSSVRVLTLSHGASAPKELPVAALIRNAHGVAEWNLFLNE